MLEALLQSPHFLYLVEPPPPGARAARSSIPPFALASRLSYFIWNSTPDEALLAAAETNQLRTREQIAAQTARMMADRRFRDTVASFHLQWLDLTELDGVEKRNSIYPLFTPDMRASMREETVRFADYVRPRGRRAARHPAQRGGSASSTAGCASCTACPRCERCRRQRTAGRGSS